MARLALQRRQVVINELQTLERQLAEVEQGEGALSMIEPRLSGQIEAFAARQEVIKARFSAAEAQVRINEAMTGVSQDFADLTATLFFFSSRRRHTRLQGDWSSDVCSS